VKDRKPVAETTPGEFRDQLAACSREYLEELLNFLASYNPDSVDEAFQFTDRLHELLAEVGLDDPGAPVPAHVHTFGTDGDCTVCGIDLTTWSRRRVTL